MPHFGLSSPPFSSPASSAMPFGESSAEEVPTSSVRLSCLSPDGRAVHSFMLRNSQAVIESHSLPLAGTVEDDVLDKDIPAIVKTTLPAHVATALQRYPALELLCVDTETCQSSSKTLQKLPSLCLYSKKDVFLLELGYERVPGGAHQVEGLVLKVSEPFDSVLLGNATSTSIVRIRPAPQQSQGYITICPAQAMAMLTYNNVLNEYSITLYHGGDDPIPTTPLVHRIELLDEQLDQFTDFCFCKSNSFSLLSGLSVALLKATGEVFQASPVLFRGTVVPHHSVTKTLEYLAARIAKEDPNSARCRLLRGAQRYMMDCFPNENSRGLFVAGQERSSAFEWTAQLQGPVLLLPESDDFETFATSIEPVPAGDLCGLAIGHVGYEVQFGLLSPTLFIPRFDMESPSDMHKLDQDLKWGAIVNRVDLRDDENEQQPICSALTLLPDPMMDTVIHYVTPTGIQSISTNALQIEANKLCGAALSGGMFSPPSKRSDLPLRTTGWSCVDLSHLKGQKMVVGAAVSADAQLGHVLITRLSDGTMAAINLTETRQLQEMEGVGDMEQLAIANTAAISNELAVLQQTAPLTEIAIPLIEKIKSGLLSMRKIAGSATPVEKITPELLAAAAQIKEQSDKDVVMPIIELNEYVASKKQELPVAFNNLVAQLNTLREMHAQVKQGEASIEEKLKTISANADALSQRSSSVLQSATDLLPTITQAEYDYFQELQRLNSRTKQWKEQLDRIKDKVSSLDTSSGTKMGKLEIAPECIDQLNAMLDASDLKMKKYSTRLKDVEDRVDVLAAVAGWDRDPHGPLGAYQ